jgi:antitoxin VapB
MGDMPTTRVFKSGNSQAVRIPAELAYADTNVDLTITRSGDVITIYPKRRGSMAEMIAALRALPTPSEIEVREPIELPDRDWD